MRRRRAADSSQEGEGGVGDGAADSGDTVPEGRGTDDPAASDDPSSKSSDKSEQAKPRRRGCTSFCCSRMCLLVWMAFLGGLTMYYRSEAGQLGMMRLVRDLGRHKARSRLRKDSAGLVPLLMGREAPMPPEMMADEESATAFTAEELVEYNGVDGAPAYLAIMGRVYDVSAGKAFYGPGRSYHHYVGRDATRSYCTGCTKPECLIGSLTGLTEWQRREAMRWAEFYEYHDKYKFVGVLRVNPVEAAVEKAMAMEESIKGMDLDAMIEAGNTNYLRGRISEAYDFWSGALVKLGEAHTDNDISAVKTRCTILMQMVGAAHKQGDMKQAVEFSQEALDGLREALGPELSSKHPLVGRALSDRAVLDYMENSPQSAISLGSQAVEVYKAALEGDSEESKKYLDDAGGREGVLAEAGNTRYNLAVVHQQSGNHSGAAKIVEALLRDYETEDESGKVAAILGAAKRLLQQIEDAYTDAEYDGEFEDLY